MKKLVFPIAIAATLLFSAFTTFSSMNWKIASGYSVKFTSPDPSGAFTSVKGDISFDPNDLASAKFNVTVDVNSIATGNGMKNIKAKNETWFNTDKYPTITFVSSKVTKTASGYQVDGTLTMHGVAKQISIPFTFANNTFTGSFSVNRIEYGVGNDEGMNAHASNDLKIDLSVPVTKA
ncbi:MAG TPA: YceI family protein [Bacteroidia bacterium]|jgi:polyisoprenoid-binding protein YceI|nr:YceI family protein [Bacteroidia bacterium]